MGPEADKLKEVFLCRHFAAPCVKTRVKLAILFVKCTYGLIVQFHNIYSWGGSKLVIEKILNSPKTVAKSNTVAIHKFNCKIICFNNC